MTNKITSSNIIGLVFLLVAVNVSADTQMVEPPPLPEPLQDGEVMEPEVNIIQKEDRTIEEYRHHGELYMIKVTPKVLY